jgi:CRP-like cAMP-binding protein
MNVQSLQGCRVLVVEDDYFLAEELCAGFRESGAEIVGPVGDLKAALALLDRQPSVQGAVLDINLRGEMVFPVADQLTQRGIPFVFSTGYDQSVIPHAFDSIPRLEKPLDTDKVLSTLASRIQPGDADGTMPWAKPFTTRLVDRFKDLIGGSCDLRKVEVSARQVLFAPGQILDAVYFPETAVVSFLAGSEGARPIGIGIVGHEGMTDLIVRDGDRAVLEAKVTIGGTAWRMEAADFVSAMASPGVGRLMLVFKEALAIQYAYSALAHGTLTIEARLARWILMLHDRVDESSIQIVHNDIADELAVRRSGVTTAMHVLEGMGAIKSIRGKIMVRDRAMLYGLAGRSYGVPEREYIRLLGA